ncbi:hypothetical protein ACFL1W_01445 [Candidatus Margulisiibacteriota bacterium]
MKRFLFGIIIIGLLAGCGWAQVPHVFLGIHWISGEVVRASGVDPSVPLGGRTAVFYVSGSSPVTGTQRLTATTADDGTFIINPFYNSDIAIDPGADAYSSAVIQGTDGYGADPVAITLDPRSFNNVRLTLAFGAGPVMAAPIDTVPLTIARLGSDVSVTWDNASYPGAQIYVLTGGGSGVFTNAYDGSNWKPYSDSAFSGEFDDSSAGRLLHLAQVSTGHPEVYFKGVVTGIDVTTPSGTATLESAWAVGKVNIELEGASDNPGKNLISVPFLSKPDTSVVNVLDEGSGSIWAEGDLLQTKFAASPAYLSAVYTGGQWRDAARPSDAPAFDINYQFGNWLITGADKTLTVVGEVVRTDEEVAVYSGEGLSTGGKTMLGMIYPTAFGLASTGLISDGAAEGDLIQYKDNPLSPVYISAVVIGGQWKNAANPGVSLDPKIATLTLPNSYIYVRFGSTGFVWRRTQP